MLTPTESIPKTISPHTIGREDINPNQALIKHSIKKSKPNFFRPLAAMFSTNQNNLNNFGGGPPNDHLYQIIFKSAQKLLQEYFCFVLPWQPEYCMEIFQQL